jgi:two-component system chemotaxis sensor kinase CheA
LPRLERIAHAAENVLGRFRDKELEPSAASVTLILRMLDCLKDVLAALEETGVEPEADDSALIDDLNAMANGNGLAPDGEVAAFSKDDDDIFDQGRSSAEAGDDILDLGASSAEAGDDMLDLGAPPAEADDDMLDLSAPVGEKVSSAPKSTASVSKPPIPKAAPAPEPKAPSGRGIAASAQNIRVSVNLLEDLMTMVSELVLTRNQLLQTLRQQDDSAFATPLQRLNHITSEIQEDVMKTRMQPTGNAWNKLPRIVRDLVQELGKKIDLDMIGAETELDRQILELIKDPLTHMVRNSCDHGLETTADRRLAGKPDEGRITLHAFHEGGHIIIRISDDGKGLPVAKIKEKVVANGIATESELEVMSHQKIIQMIFKPGFSTAQAVTNVSGRGVGMDVVRTNIEKIGGAIEFDSQEGAGSTFTIKIPLTLAIVAALIIESSRERFAIPHISVLELVRASARSEHRIENIDNATVLRFGDQLLPLAHLVSLLGLTEGSLSPDDDHFVVVSQVGPHMFGIVVDRAFDTEEIVVKPVAPVLRENPVFSGNTVLGDGSVVMILDPNGLAYNMGATHSNESASRRHDRTKTFVEGESAALLTFKAGPGAHKAVPLSLVARYRSIAVISCLS